MTSTLEQSREERAELRAAVGGFLEHVHPLASVRDLTGDEPADRTAWKRLADELDLLGVRVDVEHGGQGLSFGYVALVAEELGRRLVASPYLASVAIATEIVSRLATDEQRARWSPRLVDGTMVATCALSAAATDVRARRQGDAIVCDGEVSFVLDGAEADLLLLPVELDGRQRVVAVAGDAGGLTREPMITVDRTRRQAHLVLDGCEVELLGLADESEGADADALARVRLEAAALVAVEAVGAAEACLAGVLAYVRERSQFGQPVGTFQAVQHELADLHGELQSARAAVGHAVDLLDGADGVSAEGAVAVAALRASEALERIARQGLHLHGGIGFTWEHTSHLFLKRALGDRSAVATRQQHRSQIAHWLFSR